MAANSAMSVPETAADLIGFPVAGLIVTALARSSARRSCSMPATYVVSAVLIWAMILPRQVATPSERLSLGTCGGRCARASPSCGTSRCCSRTRCSRPWPRWRSAPRSWSASSTPGTSSTVAPVSFEQMYALLLTAIAVGSVIAGIAVGAIGDRLPKGPLVIAGFIGMGLSLVAAGLVTDPLAGHRAFFFTGAANMLFIIPTITLFQQRTPQRLMGRVVSSRQALVFGSIAASMGLSGWLAGIIGPAEVLILSGGICAAAGVIGIAVPAMRNAR